MTRLKIAFLGCKQELSSLSDATLFDDCSCTSHISQPLFEAVLR